jgi:hypothetical protein
MGAHLRGSYIMKSVLALAALAAIGFTATAFAGDATKSWATTAGPAATAPTAMSDSDMDKVTAEVLGLATATAAAAPTVPAQVRAPPTMWKVAKGRPLPRAAAKATGDFRRFLTTNGSPARQPGFLFCWSLRAAPFDGALGHRLRQLFICGRYLEIVSKPLLRRIT